MSRTRRSLVAVVTAASMIGFLASGPAFAVKASRAGSSSWSDGSVVGNRDTAADRNWTSAPWITTSGGEGSLINRSGSGASVSKDVGGTVSAVKARVSRPAPLGMACSGWNSKD